MQPKLRYEAWCLAALSVAGCADDGSADMPAPTSVVAGCDGNASSCAAGSSNLPASNDSSTRGAGGSSASGGGGGVAGAGGSATAGSGAVGGNGGATMTGGGAGGCVAGSGGHPIGGSENLGPPGTWKNVAPAEISSSYTGAQIVRVDPARASDLYAFAGQGTGVWKSTDFGSNWTKVSTGTLGDVLADGRQWAAAIDPNPARDPKTPPTMYTANGYGSVQGVFKSTDGGVNWQHYAVIDPGVNIYSLDIDPCDSRHLIGGLHHVPDIAESTDGGETWTRIPTRGSSIFAWFINTGDAATTHKTWLAISEADGGGATLQTSDGGAHWTEVSSLVHAHGSSQIFQENGGIYIAGVFGNNGSGVYRSTDRGLTWARLTPDVGLNGVFGTSKFLYSHGGGQSPSFTKAARDNVMSWTDLTTPAEMTYSPREGAVTNDGSHNIILTSNWNAGIWRYVEP